MLSPIISAFKFKCMYSYVSLGRSCLLGLIVTLDCQHRHVNKCQGFIAANHIIFEQECTMRLSSLSQSCCWRFSFPFYGYQL